MNSNRPGSQVTSSNIVKTTLLISMLLIAGGPLVAQFDIAAQQVVSEANSWESRWSGVLKNDSGPVCEMTVLLKRQGARLSGKLTYKYPRFNETYEVQGTIDRRGNFTITESTGVKLFGRFISETEMTGVRPNGPSRASPKWTFSLKRTETLRAGSIVEPQEAGRTSGNWATFFDAFRRAARSRDKAAIRVMMSHDFEYGLGFPPGTNKAAALASLDWLDWKQLDRAIARGAVPGGHSPFGRLTRIAKDRLPCGKRPCEYEIWVTFELDASNQWRWKSMIFPGD